MRALLVLSLFISTSCSTLSVQRAPAPTNPDRQSYRLPSYFLGFLPVKNAESHILHCPPDAVTLYEFEMTGVDVLISVLTVGLFVPQHMHVTCPAKPAPTSDQKS